MSDYYRDNNRKLDDGYRQERTRSRSFDRRKSSKRPRSPDNNTRYNDYNSTGNRRRTPDRRHSPGRMNDGNSQRFNKSYNVNDNINNSKINKKTVGNILNDIRSSEIKKEDKKISIIPQEEFEMAKLYQIQDDEYNNKIKELIMIDENDDLMLSSEQLEAKEEERLIEERRKRRDEINKKYIIVSKSLLETNGNGHLDNDLNASITPNYQDEATKLLVEKQIVEEETKLQREKISYDMFSASPTNQPLIVNAYEKNKYLTMIGDDRNQQHLQSNWDDNEGYYKARIGDMISERYRILGIVGKGIFSTVLKCIDTKKTPDEDNNIPIAIKMIRNNDIMRKAAEKERQILTQISQIDRDNKKHCVKLFSTLDYRNHIAFVFEYQTMNLREALKKFGKDVGINISALRLYCKQLFIALKLLSDLQIVHADIKLDNILCSEDLKQVKLCDFGSAFYTTDTDNLPTPYLVSRFYRAPEIMLGLSCKFVVLMLLLFD